LKEKIKKIDSCKLFILPSKSEGLPQSLIEAMAREKIVITSDNRAGKELLLDKKNGFLFKIGEEKELAEVINKIKYNNLYSIKKQAKKRVEMFRWKNVINNLTNLF
jgi:glycosyltransferase involved in cell wall biosynthesis